MKLDHARKRKIYSTEILTQITTQPRASKCPEIGIPPKEMTFPWAVAHFSRPLSAHPVSASAYQWGVPPRLKNTGVGDENILNFVAYIGKRRFVLNAKEV